MKFNVFLAVVMAVVCALLGFIAYLIARDGNEVIMAVATGVCALLTLVPAQALKLDSERLAVNAKLMAWGMFLLTLVLNFVMCIIPFGHDGLTVYCVVMAIVMLAYIAFFYKLIKTEV